MIVIEISRASVHNISSIKMRAALFMQSGASQINRLQLRLSATRLHDGRSTCQTLPKKSA
jgi:hypothetical protein